MNVKGNNLNLNFTSDNYYIKVNFVAPFKGQIYQQLAPAQTVFWC